MWVPTMDEIILAGALAKYKVKYGYSRNKDIDLEKLGYIIKEVTDEYKEKKEARKREASKRRRDNSK